MKEKQLDEARHQLAVQAPRPYSRTCEEEEDTRTTQANCVPAVTVLLRFFDHLIM